MTCWSEGAENCYAASIAAVVLAEGMLGAPYEAQFLSGCELLGPEPTPAPTTFESTQYVECYPIMNSTGLPDLFKSVGWIKSSACGEMEDLVESGTKRASERSELAVRTPAGATKRHIQFARLT